MKAIYLYFGMLAIILSMGVYSCSLDKEYKYTITIPFGDGSFYYHVNDYKMDSLTRCIIFRDDCLSKGEHGHTLCGTYQITQNR